MSDYGSFGELGMVRFERLLPGPIDRIWSYLTDSNKRAGWLAAGVMECRLGGKLELTFRNSELTDNDGRPPAKYAAQAKESRQTGRVTICRSPTLLSYTWGEPSGAHSEVSFELTAQGDQVQLVLTHRRLGTREEIISVAAGWHTHLGILSDRLNGRAPAGFWTTHTRLEEEYSSRVS